MTLLQTESKDLPWVWRKAYRNGYYNSLQLYQEVGISLYREPEEIKRYIPLQKRG